MTEEITKGTEASQRAAEQALQAIRERSFSGRHPELGKMINCQFCGLRHRENERKCEQKFVIELTPPEGLTHLTARQVFGAARFNKTRRRPRNKPSKPMTMWERILKTRQRG